MIALQHHLKMLIVECSAQAKVAKTSNLVNISGPGSWSSWPAQKLLPSAILNAGVQTCRLLSGDEVLHPTAQLPLESAAMWGASQGAGLQITSEQLLHSAAQEVQQLEASSAATEQLKDDQHHGALRESELDKRLCMANLWLHFWAGICLSTLSL